MREQVGKIPAPLRGMVYRRFAVGLVGLVFMPVILVFGGGFSACALCVAVMAFGGNGGLTLMAECLEKRYVVLEGICSKVEKSKTGRDIRAVWIKKEGMSVRIISREKRVKGLSTGDRLAVYISGNTPVYDMDEYKVAGACLAIERKEGQHDEG